MDDVLLDYYERELTFIREMGADFARKYPKIAGRLLIEPDKCEDPHTERLIEAFAFLCGRIYKKIDDGLPEITQSLLNILYPHYVNPIPSMSVVSFEPVKHTIPAVGYNIPKNTPLYSKPVGGHPCQFTTRYPVTLWPIEVTAATLQDPPKNIKGAQRAIVLELKTFNNMSFSEVAWKKLRFFLNGPHQHVYHLYELLFNHVCHLELECRLEGKSGRKKTFPLSSDFISPVGFNADDVLVPRSSRSSHGYLLLTEYFCFPEKFLFFDLHGLNRLEGEELGDRLEIWIYLNRRPKADMVINKDTFSLNDTPVVNVYSRIAEPIRAEHTKSEYHILPDVRRPEATEVLSVEKVTATAPGSSGKSVVFQPIYSIRHHLDEESVGGRKAFWHAKRRPSLKKGDKGTEVYLSFADVKFNRVDPGVETVTVHTLCTNRDLPARLPFGDSQGDFTLEISAPVERIVCLIKPTPTRRTFLEGALQWRLISHLSLNYLSLAQEGEAGPLREILKLYDFEDSPVTKQQIDGIVSLKSVHVTKRIRQSFCRGVEVTIEFDEDKFVGGGVYLFASVLDAFLGDYVSVNSFSQLVARTMQKKEVLKRWPPRNGSRILL